MSCFSLCFSINFIPLVFPTEANVFDQIMTTVVQAAVEFPDFPTQKLCFGILKKMIEHLGMFCFVLTLCVDFEY